MCKVHAEYSFSHFCLQPKVTQTKIILEKLFHTFCLYIHNHVAQLGIFEGRGLTNTTGTLNILLGECILKSYFLDLEAKEIAWEFSGFHPPPFVTKIISPVTLLIQIH